MSGIGRTLVHGYGPYSHGVCRCDVCTKAAREYRRGQRARHLADRQLQHGLRATYDCGCRCVPCKQARHAAHVREYQPKAAAS